jgi:hypothetical protein
MKRMLVYIMITGILPGAQALSRAAALKCYTCMSIEYNNDYAKTYLDRAFSGMPSCYGAESETCAEGSDSCASNIASYTIKIGDTSTNISQVINVCLSPLADVSSQCDSLESKLSADMFKDMKCKTETCTTDGCNNKRALPICSTTGLSASFLLLASIVAMDMLN